MHGWSAEHDELARGLGERIRSHFAPPRSLGRTPTPEEVAALGVITPDGVGIAAALRLVDDTLLPNVVALDHPQFLAYIPAAPATTAALFDAVVGAWSFSGENWLEAGAAVAAENAALGWMRRSAGLPEGAGGCFVSGGSAANLSALAVARDVWRAEHGARDQLAIACAASAHSSVRTAAALLDLDVVEIAGDGYGRLTGAALRAGIAGRPVCAAVASAGATNTGAVDELAAVADVCADAGLWFHVDAAYGGAALCLPELAELFRGVEQCDSIVIDPHKWLFSPLDCAALLYRRPELAARTHRQSAEYLEAFGDEQINPSDLAFHLTRRTRGLPFWFTLAVHGTEAFATAVRAGIEHARRAAELIAGMGEAVRLVMEPQLSVVLFDRVGWTRADWYRWAEQAMVDQLAFVLPTTWQGRAVGRLVFVHPDTDMDAVARLLRRLEA